MGVDRFRVCELYAAGPGIEGSGSGYRIGDRLVLTARHVIAPAVAEAGGRVLVRPVGVTEWLPARVAWEDADVDVALIVMEDEGWRAPTGESVLRWGELTGSDPVPCAAVGFPWASVRPDRMRDTAHIYGRLAPVDDISAPDRGLPAGLGPSKLQRMERPIHRSPLHPAAYSRGVLRGQCLAAVTGISGGSSGL